MCFVLLLPVNRRPVAHEEPSQRSPNMIQVYAQTIIASAHARTHIQDV